jgi:hypothetical protein
MALVVSGRLNKQVAGELGIHEFTVKVHRGKMMRKMKANSLPDLVKMAMKLRISSEPQGPQELSISGVRYSASKSCDPTQVCSELIGPRQER